jgi:exopolysaccharide biosynthesis protein
VAFGLTPRAALAVVVDGRSPDDAGMTLWELADLMVDLGAAEALNLDGGSAGALVVGGRLRNTPRDDEGEPCDPSSPATSAIVFAAAR